MANELALYPEILVGEVEHYTASPMDRMRAWSEAFDLWLTSRRSANTRRAYHSAWRAFLGFSQRQPWEATRTDVSRWVDAMRKQGLSEASVNQAVAAISSFYCYARDEYEVTLPDGRRAALHDSNPAASKSLRTKVNPYGKANYLDAAQSRALLGAIKRDTVQGLRDYALFLLYLVTGRRNTEARTLTWGAFEQSGGRVYYRWSGKGKKDKRFECPGPAWQAIVDYLKAAGRLESMVDEDYIFTALTDYASRLPNVQAESWDPYAQPLSMRMVGHLVKKYAKRAGLEASKIHVHTLRHTAAMLRKEAGDRMEDICSFLAHSSLAITQVYMHEVEGRKDENWSRVEALLGL